MQHLCELGIWLLVAFLHHPADTRAPGSTSESAFVSGVNRSPLLNAGRNEIDILLSFVGEPPLPTASVLGNAFSSTTGLTAPSSEDLQSRPQADGRSIESIASNARPQVHTKTGQEKGRSTDAVVDNVLQAYKGVFDKAGRGPLECKNSTAFLSRALCAVWAGQFLDSNLHYVEPPSTRKTFMKYIVKYFLSEEHDWLEHLEDAVCNCYYAIVKKVLDSKRCYECKVIVDEIVFVFLVEDLLKDILASQHEVYVADAVRRLLELNGISNRKRSVWEALFNAKQNLHTKKNVPSESKKSRKHDVLSKKPLVSAVFSNAASGTDITSIWKPRTSHISKGGEKRSTLSDYEGAPHTHLTGRTQLQKYDDFSPFDPFFEYEEEIYDEHVYIEKNRMYSSISQRQRPKNRSEGSPNMRSSDEEPTALLTTELVDLGQPVSPLKHEVTFSSTDYSDMTLLKWVIPDSTGDDGKLLGKIKKHSYPQLKEKKTDSVDESPQRDMKMLQTHNLDHNSDISISVSQEINEENKGMSSQVEENYDEGSGRNINVGSYTDSERSPFLSVLGRRIQFPEKMKSLGWVDSALRSKTSSLASSKTKSSDGSKLILNDGKERTGTSKITADPSLNLIRKSRHAGYETVEALDLLFELKHLLSPSPEQGEDAMLRENTERESRVDYVAESTASPSQSWQPHTTSIPQESATADPADETTQPSFFGKLFDTDTHFVKQIPTTISNLGEYVMSIF